MPDLTDTVRRYIADNCTEAGDIIIEQSIAEGTGLAETRSVTITITDACENSHDTTLTVEVPQLLTIAVSQGDTAVCRGESVLLPTTVTGGVGPYDYAWGPTVGLPGTDAVEVTPDDTTAYIVTVTDQNGCTAMDTVTVNVDTLPQVPELSQLPNVACHGGDANGSITIESPVPAGWYNYSLDGADYQDTTNVYTGLAQGPHTITVTTDAFSRCSATQTITVENSPAIPSVLVDSLIDVQFCPTQGRQAVTAEIRSGLAPFVVTWDGAEMSVTDSLSAEVTIAAGVCDSVYTVTVSIVDGNECDASNTYTFHVTDTTAPVLSGTMDTVRMHGCTADVIEAAAPLAMAEDALTALGITISDFCTQEGGFTVSSRSDTTGHCPIVVTRRYTVTDRCGNVSDTVEQVILVHDSLAPVVTVASVTTELNACGVSSAPAVAENAEELQTIGFAFADACTSDARLTVAVTADTSGTDCPKVITRRYTVTDECGNTSGEMTHIISIFDSVAPAIGGELAEVEVEGCSYEALGEYPIATTWAQLSGASYSNGISLTEECTDPDELEVRCLETQSGTCPTVVTRKYVLEDGCGNVSDTLVHILRYGDNTPPDFHITLSDSLLVSDNCEFVVPDFVRIVMNTLTDNCTATNALTVEQSPLAGASVTENTLVTITATDECNNTDTITVTVLMPSMPQLSVNLSDTAICQGSSVELVTSVENGTAPMTYVWTETPANTIDNPAALTITVAPEEVGDYNYSVTVTDANGCIATVEDVLVTVNETPDTAVTVTTPNTLCTGGYNGTITVQSPVDPGGYYLYSLDGGEYQPEPLFEGLAAGDYDLTVKTDDGCLSETVTVHVGASEELPSVRINHETEVLCPNAGNQDVTAVIEGGEAPYRYEWVGSIVDPDGDAAVVAIDETVCDSVYSFTVNIRDTNNCVATASASIRVLDNTPPQVTGNAESMHLYNCSADAAPSALTVASDLEDIGYRVSDNCAMEIDDLEMTLVSTVVNDSCPILITRTYLLTDACGNVSDSIREYIIIEDNTAPLVESSTATTEVNGCSASYAPPQIQEVTQLAELFDFEDECNAEMTLSVEADTSTTNCPLIITRTYTLSDRCDNVSNEMVHTIYIYDSIAPYINGRIDTVTIDGCGLEVLEDRPMPESVSEFLGLSSELSITEQCTLNDDLLLIASQSVVWGCPIIVTRTYSVEDECGNGSNAITQVFRIQDTMRPQFNITFADSTLTGFDCEFFVPDFAQLVSERMTDNCTDRSDILVYQRPVAGDEITHDTSVVITLEDNCGIVNTMTVRVLIPTIPTATITQRDTAFCEGGSVILTVDVTDGTPGYLYSWTPTDGLSSTDEARVTASPDAGSYSYEVNVRDANGCETDAQVQVTVHEAPLAATAATTENTLCTGGFNGTITIQSPLGDGYQYSIDGENYQPEVLFDSLRQDFYTIHVMTDNGCISEPAVVEVVVSLGMPTVSFNAPDDVICPNAGVQTVSAVITGGTAPFTYEWTGAEPTPGEADIAVISPLVIACDTLYIFSVHIEDINHCENSATDTIVVRDDELPTISGEVAVRTYNGCTVDVLPAAARTAEELAGLGLEIADNCTQRNSLVVAHHDEVSSNCPIVVQRYYTVTDGCGNVNSEFVQTLQVFDSAAPIVTVAAIETNLNGCNDSIVPSAVTTPSDLQTLGFVFWDECTDAMDLTVSSTQQMGGSCPTVITRKYVVMDACGNVSDTMTHTITVFDSVAPAIYGAIAAETIDGCDTTELRHYPIATSAEALESLGVHIVEQCSDVTVTCVQTVTGECPIVVTRTYTVTDACDNLSNEVTQVINIQDTIAPYFTTTIPTQYLTGDGGHFYIPDFSTMISAIIDDNCTPVGQIGITQNPAANMAVTENQTVTVFITDECGNMDSTHIDVEVPESLIINIVPENARFCFGDSVLLTSMVGGGTPDFDFSWSPSEGLSATDVQNVVARPAPGIYHYVVTVTDGNGSTASDSVTVIVDSIPAIPQVTHEDNTVCDGTPNGTITITAPLGEGYTYSIDGNVYQSETEFTGLASGTYTVTVLTPAGCVSEPADVVIDSAVRIPSVTLVVPTTILCPNVETPEVTAEITDGTAPFNIEWSGDGVQSSTTTTTTVNIDASQCDQLYVVTFEVTDDRNCTAMATDTIRVRDDEIPTITGPLAVATSNGCTAEDAPDAATDAEGLIALGLTLGDNCTFPSDLSVAHRDEVSGTCPIVITRYYTVTDLCDNTSEVFVQTLQVFDSVPPLVRVNNVETPVNGCDASAADPAVTTPQELQALGFAFDEECTAFASLQVSNTESVAGTCPTTITRKYVVTDACGNVSDTMSHVIVVNDNTAPVISGTIDDVTLDGCDTIVLQQRPVATTVAALRALGNLTIQEVCSEDDMTVQVSQTVTEGCPITVVRTYTVTDLCDNVSNEVTETILIQDAERPVFSAQVEEHLLASDNCQFVVPDLTEEVRAVSSDNCTTDAAALTITQSPAVGTPVTADMTVDVTVTDACNNSSVMTVQLRLPVTVTVGITPSTTQYCEWDVVELTVTPEGGDGDYTYAWTPATGLNTTTAATVEVSTENQQYAYNVTVTDGNGCTATAAYTLPEPSHLTVTAAIQSAINCFEGSDGVAVATADNGVGNYSYEWSNGTTSAVNNGLAEGTYTVTVTDAYNCTASAEVSLEHPTALTATVSDETAVLCFGDANGSGKVTPASGTAPYTVSIDNNATTYNVAAGANYTFTQLAAGGYTVLVTDANGCTFNTTLTITSPEQLVMSAGTITMPRCNQGDDGNAIVNVTGGTLPYVLTMGATTIATMNDAGDQQVDNLAAGTYTVTATDANGCTTQVSFTVNEPALLTLTQVGVVNVSCNGLSDATATVTFTGGTAPYTLYVDNDQQLTTVQAVQNVNFTDLAAGTHTVGIRDANGCVTTMPVTITEPAVLTMTAGNIVDVLCFDDANGSAVVTPTGGTAPYTVSINNFTTSQTVAAGATGTFSNLTAGDYTAVVRDANGCEATADFTIGTPTALELTEVSTINPLCYQAADGEIVVNVSEGTAPYSITVNGTAEVANLAAGNYTIADRPAGSYTIVATDANGCTATVTSVLTDPALLTLTEAATTPITCFGGDDGTATLTVAGGTAGYTVWTGDNQQSQTLASATEQATFTGLNGGDHVFTVTDDHNCTATLTITFIEPDPMSTVVNAVTDVICYGESNGTAVVTISGGTLPYVMTVSDEIPVITLNTEDPYTITGLWENVYTVSIVDDHGCTAQMEITVQQPDSLSAIASVLNNVDCFGALTGMATVLPEGGVPPYTYAWTGDRNDQTIDSLAAGQYFVTVTDANGCTATDSTDISEPEELTLTLITLTESCNGEETAVIEVEVNGGTPDYTVVWSNGMEDVHIENLAVGPYTVTVTDQHNCFDTMTVVVPFHGMPDFTVSVTPAYCDRADGTATVVGDNLANYNYNWNTTPNPNAPSNTQLSAGNYTLVVDDEVCTLALPFTIDNIPGPTAIYTADPTSFMEGHTVRFVDHSTGSVAMWEYDFGDGAYASTPTAVHEYDIAGEYWTILTVTDEHNCVDTAMVLITVVPDVVIYVPNAFTPNDDGVNDVWLPIISNITDKFFEVVIYSRWGEVIFKSNDPNVGWNGKHNGKMVEAGVFTYKITYGDVFGKKYFKTGTVAVIR